MVLEDWRRSRDAPSPGSDIQGNQSRAGHHFADRARGRAGAGGVWPSAFQKNAVSLSAVDRAAREEARLVPVRQEAARGFAAQEGSGCAAAASRSETRRANHCVEVAPP